MTLKDINHTCATINTLSKSVGVATPTISAIVVTTPSPKHTGKFQQSRGCLSVCVCLNSFRTADSHKLKLGALMYSHLIKRSGNLAFMVAPIISDCYSM